MNKILTSTIDKSKNIIIPHSAGGFFEARYVQRTDDYFIVYLSSHSGCNLSCRMCHLTQTGQTVMNEADNNEYMSQAKDVFDLFEPDGRIRKVHFNFMARGEALDNNTMLYKSSELFKNLDTFSQRFDLESKFKVSSIIPAHFSESNASLSNIFEDSRSQLYYSLYSVDPKFRKRWLPKAMNPFAALDLIKDMQEENEKEIVVHWSLIDGQNTSDESVIDTLKAVVDRGIKAKFNLVRYNSYGPFTGVEPSEVRINEILALVNDLMPNESNKIVPRVGKDVYASCGTFYAGED